MEFIKYYKTKYNVQCRVVVTNLLLETFHLIRTNYTTLQMSFSYVDVDDSMRDDYKYYDVSLLDTMKSETIKAEHSYKYAITIYFYYSNHKVKHDEKGFTD